MLRPPPCRGHRQGPGRPRPRRSLAWPAPRPLGSLRFIGCGWRAAPWTTERCGAAPPSPVGRVHGHRSGIIDHYRLHSCLRLRNKHQSLFSHFSLTPPGTRARCRSPSPKRAIDSDPLEPQLVPPIAQFDTVVNFLLAQPRSPDKTRPSMTPPCAPRSRAHPCQTNPP